MSEPIPQDNQKKSGGKISESELESKLTKLKELHEKNLITTEEYNEKKRAILSEF